MCCASAYADFRGHVMFQVCGFSRCGLARQQYIVISINNSFVCSSCRCDERCDNPSASWEYVGRSDWATIRLLCTKTKHRNHQPTMGRMGHIATRWPAISRNRCGVHVAPSVGLISLLWLLGATTLCSAEQIETNDIQQFLSGLSDGSDGSTIEMTKDKTSSQWGIADVATPVGKLFELVLPKSNGTEFKVSLPFRLS